MTSPCVFPADPGQGDKLTWSLQKDIIAYVEGDFDLILTSHGLKENPQALVPALVFSEPPDTSAAWKLKESYNDVADSILLIQDEKEQLYLQAYLCWLVLAVGEEVRRDDLLSAERLLHNKYRLSLHNLLYGNRSSTYFGSQQASLCMHFGLGSGRFSSHSGRILKPSYLLSFGMGVRVWSVEVDATFRYQRGRVPESFIVAHRTPEDTTFQYYDQDVYGLYRLFLRLGYPIIDRPNLDIVPFVGYHLSGVSVFSSLIEGGSGSAAGLRIEFLLGKDAERFDESLLFGIIKSKGIRYSRWLLFTEIQVSQQPLSGPEVSNSYNIGFLVGLKFIMSEKSQRKKLNFRY